MQTTRNGGPSQCKAIDYAAAPPRGRRWAIRAIGILLLLVVGYLGYRFAPWAWREARVLYWQRQCLGYRFGDGEVVYEEEPAAAALLLARSSQYAPYPLNRSASPGVSSPVKAAARVPSCWTQYDRLVGRASVQAGRSFGAVIFLHERISPSGHHRLVFVRYFPETDTFTSSFIQGYNIEQLVLTPQTLTHPVVFAPRTYVIRVLSGVPAHPPLVRMYGGQPDPADPSHFTVRYQMWGKEDVIDGRLDDQDQVTLIPRNPPHE